MTDPEVSYILVDGVKFVGFPPSKDAIKRMSTLYFNDTGKLPVPYVNINGEIHKMGEA